MPLVAPNVGLDELLDIILRKTVSGVVDWELFLFSNNYTPVQATVWADLTEANFTGYSRVTLGRANWTAATVASNKAVSTYTTTAQQWTCTASPQTIYGYGIKHPTTNELYIVERFGTPQVLTVGAIIGVLPRVTLTTEP